MFSNKEQYTFTEYLDILACFINHAYESSPKTICKFSIDDTQHFLTIYDYTTLHIISDMASAYFQLTPPEKVYFEIQLFHKFYKTYPESFIKELDTAIQSSDTILGDCTDFICKNLAKDAFEKLEMASFIALDITTNLTLISGVFKATKCKNKRYIGKAKFILNYDKLKKIKFDDVQS